MTPKREGEAGGIPAWLEELERLEREASPLPWKIENDGGDMYMRAGDEGRISLMCDMRYYPWTPDREEDWRAIVAMRNALPELLSLARKHYSSPEEAQREAR